MERFQSFKKHLLVYLFTLVLATEDNQVVNISRMYGKK